DHVEQIISHDQSHDSENNATVNAQNLTDMNSGAQIVDDQPELQVDSDNSDCDCPECHVDAVPAVKEEVSSEAEEQPNMDSAGEGQSTDLHSQNALASNEIPTSTTVSTEQGTPQDQPGSIVERV